MADYQEIPVERDGDTVRVPSFTISPIEEALDLQQQFNDMQNIAAAFMLRSLLTHCGNCGEPCLIMYESSLCQECINWPSEVLEDILDAEVIG